MFTDLFYNLLTSIKCMTQIILILVDVGQMHHIIAMYV